MHSLALQQALHDRGLRLTRSRLAVLQVLSASAEHLKVAEVHRRARQIDGRVGLASVYRTMELLAQMGLVKHVHLDHRHRHYASITEDHSHHLVCTSCGLAVEFSDCRLERLTRTIARRTDFKIEGHCMEFFGRCARCRQNSRHPSGSRRAQS
ncbi:MAG TPA: Fur family transcriptional regulator [Candidatus Acidoferrum sp.]|nr:Fur family transcriptional regulator [Candidatus Acidoferrum sp.]